MLSKKSCTLPGIRSESPGALQAYDDYAARHNDAAQAAYCVDNEAYKARNMKDEMSSIATLDAAKSSFFDHRDPAMVKWLSEASRPT